MNHTPKQHGAGATIAGQKVGGQFAPDVKTGADGSALTPPAAQLSPEEHHVLLASINRQQMEMRETYRAMHAYQVQLFQAEAAHLIRAEYPAATTLVLGRNYDADSVYWQYAGVRDETGNIVATNQDFEESMDSFVFGSALNPEDNDFSVEAIEGSDHPSAMQWSELTEIDLIAAERHGVNHSRAFVDTESLDEGQFSKVWAAAERRLNLSTASIRTRGDWLNDIEEEWTRADGSDLSEEELDQLAERSSKLYAED